MTSLMECSSNEIGKDKKMEIFQLQPIVDNPIFEGFSSGDSPSILGRECIRDDFFPENMSKWDWALPSLARSWKPLKVEGRVRSFNDYPALGLLIPVFSRRAVDSLRDFLEPNGEILPLIHSAGEYYAFNCMKIAEILNHQKSKADWDYLEPRMASHVRYFSIFEERLSPLRIFRMREMPNRVFVTTPFVERVAAAGLNGFHFMKIWPFPEGVDYWMEDKKNRKAANELKTASGFQNIKAESLIICFPTQEAKLSKEERERIREIEKELDGMLYTTTLSTPFWGCLEGRRGFKGMVRLYLSCPNAEKLFQKLSHWLKELKWSPRPVAVLRQFPFDDVRTEGREVST